MLDPTSAAAEAEFYVYSQRSAQLERRGDVTRLEEYLHRVRALR